MVTQSKKERRSAYQQLIVKLQISIINPFLFISALWRILDNGNSVEYVPKGDKDSNCYIPD